MVLPQAMAWVQYWFRVLSLKFLRKILKNLRWYITGITRFLHVWLLPALNATGKKRAIQKKNNISLRHSIQSVLWEVGGTLTCEIECNEYCSLPPGCSDVYCSPQFARWGKTRIPKCLTSSVLCQKNYLWSRFSRRNAASKNTPTIVQNVCHIKTSVNVSNVCLSCHFCQSAGANLKNDFLFCKTPGQFQPLVIRLSSGGGKQDVFVNMFEPYDV